MCNIDHLSITYHKNQISEKNLLSLNCETIKLWSVTTSSRSLNKFIKKWLFTFDTRFQYLEIPILHLIEEDSNPWNIFKDLEISAFDEGKRAEYYKRYDWDFETWVVERDCLFHDLKNSNFQKLPRLPSFHKLPTRNRYRTGRWNVGYNYHRFYIFLLFRLAQSIPGAAGSCPIFG